MKKYLLSFFVLFTLASFSYSSVSFEPIVNALKSGNVDEIAKYFDNSVEITLPGKSGSYNKTQAKTILQDFFKSITIKNFEVIHKSENTSSQYCIGNLITDRGSYRTTIFMKQKGEQHLIQELRFEANPR
jgi:hypothetical protein